MDTSFLWCVVLVLIWRCDPTFQVLIDIRATVMEMATSEGYPVEEHVARTPDGYLLRVQRIPPGDKGPGLPPVLLVHGMLGSASDFLVMGRGRSLGYLLADAGYDVFLGNLRFNIYASHVNKSKSDQSYWDFGIDEHGELDVPAMVELVLRVSGTPALHYVGYSMGTTSYMMMCAARPDLAVKMLSFVGLAPAVHMSNLQPLARLVFGLRLPEMLKARGLNALSLGGRYQRALASSLCNPRVPSEDLCFTLVFLFIGDDYDQIEWKLASTVFAKFQPATIKQLEHYFQLSLTDTLNKYDYGVEENKRRYGSESPPSYDLKANKAPVALFYGNNDRLTSPGEIQAIAKAYRETNTLIFVRKVPWKKFNHYDFIFAKDLPTLVNNEIVHLLNNITRTNDDTTNKAHVASNIVR